MLNFQVGSRTDIGRKRSQNQDSFAAEPALGLFVVADGMGGHKGGEIASAMAVSIIVEQVRAGQNTPNWQAGTLTAGALLKDAIACANAMIFERSANDASLRGMGTTTTALLFKGQDLIIGHVGDSRCYYFSHQGKPDAVWQLTRDHSLVQEKLRAGLITREEVELDQFRNVITRSVGFEEEVNVELYEFKTTHGDTFLLCSDGLSGLASDEEILRIVRDTLGPSHQSRQNPGAADQATEKLIAQANENGGDDNITAVLVRC